MAIQESSHPLRSAAAPVIRRPTLSDAVRMYELVKSAGNLDVNSLYLYLLLCRDFSATCRVAEVESRPVGMVTAYLPSHQPRLVFIWQVAVAEEFRGRGIAMAMLSDLTSGLAAADPWFLQTTITPSNTASIRLFTALARKFRTPISTTEGFHERLFEPYRHEAEILYTLGPIVSVCEEQRSPADVSRQ
jgi:L-2,4-diaminobutyric acid acetyltransferase